MSHSPERVEASVQAMRVNYPLFSVGGRPLGTGVDAVWKGWLQPIRTRENLEWILADIAQHRTVRILQNGEVVHDPSCSRKHPDVLGTKKLKKPDQAFKIKIVYSGGKDHPQAYVTDPVIPAEKRKHMFADGAVCAYPPWQNVWDWQKHTVSDFADQTAIWLVKWNVWRETRIWLGGEMQHNKVFLYLTLRPSDQCWCTSGEQYGTCHRMLDEREALQHLFSFSKSKSYGFQL